MIDGVKVQVITIAGEMYNRQSPHEVRVPPDCFGHVWEVKGQ